MAKIGVMVGQVLRMTGVGIIAIEQVRNLNKLGYDAELIILKRTKYPVDEYIKDIPVRYISDEMNFFERISFRIPFFSFFSLLYLTYPFYVHRYIKKEQYSVIVSHETYTCFVAIAIKRKVGIPFLAMVYDPISYILPRVYSKRFLHFFFPLLIPIAKSKDKAILNKSAGAVTCSGMHEKMIHDLSPKTRCFRIYPGCYPKKKIARQGRDIIISLTKWDIGKNPKFIVDVLSRIKNKEIKWVVAGNWLQEEVKRGFISYAKEKGVLDRINIVGRISEKEKEALLSRAKVLVHPIIEAFGMFGLEAAGCGCPVIVPKGSGVSELFIHGVDGFFPKEGDIESFVKYVDLLLGDEKKSYEISKAAWLIAKKNAWKDNALDLIKVLSKTVGSAVLLKKSNQKNRRLKNL